MLLPKLYPLTFRPIIKEKIWGGTRLKKRFDKGIASEKCGEVWELSTISEDVSVVANGELSGRNLTKLISEYKGELVGHNVFEKFGDRFPLLVKFIDANRDLSIQVHPNDEQAKPFNSFGKNEFWYVLDAENGSELFSGFNKPVTPEEFKAYLKDNKLPELLLKEKVVKGDAFFMPAGRIHNIGEGVVIAEIQQASDITYRLYDFDRTDSNGNKRDLHVEEGLSVLDFDPVTTGKTKYEQAENQLVNLASCENFTVNKLLCNEPIIRDFSKLDSFVIYTCIEGELRISVDGNETAIKAGDVYLVPAVFESLTLNPTEQSLILETYIEG